MRRRDLAIGLSCLAAGGAAYALKPRREVTLLPKGESLDSLVPIAPVGWIGQDISDPVALNGAGEGTLASKLYNQSVVRLYTNSATSSQRVQMLLAYGSRQTDNLQLHRPEVCYPAFGYTLLKNRPARTPLSRVTSIPTRHIVAETGLERQYITYWTRLGEHLPQNGGQQREARYLNAFQGLVPDGVLCRFTMVAEDELSAWRVLDGFIESLLLGIRPDRRGVLIGLGRAAALAGISPKLEVRAVS